MKFFISLISILLFSSLALALNTADINVSEPTGPGTTEAMTKTGFCPTKEDCHDGENDVLVPGGSDLAARVSVHTGQEADDTKGTGGSLDN